jgi:hypothetical protein
MTTATTTPKFTTGVILATPGATAEFDRNGHTPFEFLKQHISGDWGELCEEDRDANNQALVDGSRLLSAYRLKDGTKIWCITEAVGENGHREATTFLLPEEY